MSSKQIDLLFKVREPAYNLIKYINHQGEHAKHKDSLRDLINTLRTADSFKKWVVTASIPKDCRVDFNDKELFDAYAQYFSSFFRTSLDITTKIYCDRCGIYDYKIGSKKLTDKSKKEVRPVMDAYLDTLQKPDGSPHSQESIELLYANKESAAYHALLYCTYVFESAKRVSFVGEGPVVHALWMRLTPKQKKNLSLHEYEKQKKELVAFLSNN
jgi:hypothetical protein